MNPPNRVEELQEVHVIHEREISNIELEAARHRMELEDKKLEIEKDTWKSCCLVVSKPMISYLTQATVLGGVIIFSCIQLMNEAEPQSLYVGLLSTCIGLLIPSPMNNESKK